MRSRVLTSVIWILTCCPLITLASREGVLVWSSFSIVSDGIGDSGSIRVNGECSGPEVRSLVVKAFGKEYGLAQEQLKELEGLYVNAMQLSYESGDKETGGRRIYLVVSTGFTSHSRAGKRITIKEGGEIEVTNHSPGQGPRFPEVP